MKQQSQRANLDWAVGLPADLWVNIFSEFAVNSTEELSLASDSTADKCIETQACHHRLSLVCRRFRNVVQQHQPWSQTLVLPRNLGSQSLPSMELWLNRHGMSVQELWSFSNSHTSEAALEVLKLSSPKLVGVFLNSCSQKAVDKLSLLSSVTICELAITMRLSISALYSLKNLCSLHLLKGIFVATKLPDHLTRLTLDSARLRIVSGKNGNCAESLKILTLKESRMYGMGLTACIHLESLCCWSAFICPDVVSEEIFSTQSGVVDFLSDGRLSALSHVKDVSLKFNVCTRVHSNVDLTPLYALTSLESLRVECVRGVVRATGNAPPLYVQSAFTRLSKLSQVHLEGVGCGLVLDVEWEVMPVLQSLTLCGDIITNKRIVGLSRLSSLRHLDMISCDLFDGETNSIVKTLLCNMRAHCSHVGLSINAEMFF